MVDDRELPSIAVRRRSRRRCWKTGAKILAGYLSGPQTYLYNIASNTWTQTGTKKNNDRSDEEGWVKLPDDSILSYDVFVNTGNSSRHGAALHPLDRDSG